MAVRAALVLDLACCHAALLAADSRTCPARHVSKPHTLLQTVVSHKLLLRRICTAQLRRTRISVYTTLEVLQQHVATDHCCCLWCCHLL